MSDFSSIALMTALVGAALVMSLVVELPSFMGKLESEQSPPMATAVEVVAEKPLAKKS